MARAAAAMAFARCLASFAASCASASEVSGVTFGTVRTTCLLKSTLILCGCDLAGFSTGVESSGGSFGVSGVKSFSTRCTKVGAGGVGGVTSAFGCGGVGVGCGCGGTTGADAGGCAALTPLLNAASMRFAGITSSSCVSSGFGWLTKNAAPKTSVNTSSR